MLAVFIWCHQLMARPTNWQVHAMWLWGQLATLHWSDWQYCLCSLMKGPFLLNFWSGAALSGLAISGAARWRTCSWLCQLTVDVHALMPSCSIVQRQKCTTGNGCCVRRTFNCTSSGLCCIRTRTANPWSCIRHGEIQWWWWFKLKMRRAALFWTFCSERWPLIRALLYTLHALIQSHAGQTNAKGYHYKKPSYC